MLILGASSLHHSLEKCDNIRRRLIGKVISKPGYNLYPSAKDKYKIVQNRLRYVLKNSKIILWHHFIIKSVTNPKSDSRTPLKGDQLKVEIERLHRKVDIVVTVYCVREGAPEVYKKLKEIEIPVLHIVKNLLCRRIQKVRKCWKSTANFTWNHSSNWKCSSQSDETTVIWNEFGKKKNSEPQKQPKKKCPQIINFGAS